MAVSVKCPKCRTVVDTGGRSYPRCPHCNEYLAKCRYCTHLMPVVDECNHPEIGRELVKEPGDRPHIADVDAVINCPYHDTKLRKVRTLPPDFGYAVARVTLTSLIVIILAFGIFRYAMRSVTGVKDQVFIHTALNLPNRATTAQPVLIDITASNWGWIPAPTVQIRINEDLFRSCDLVDITPKPLSSVGRGNGRYLTYGSLAPHTDLHVHVRVQPRSVGYYDVSVQALCPGYSYSRGAGGEITVM